MSPPAQKCGPSPRSSTARAASILGDLGGSRGEGGKRRAVDRVQHLGTVEDDLRDRPIAHDLHLRHLGSAPGPGYSMQDLKGA